ncbi:MAG: ABC transporter substrate-binding protein [Roseomonas sp.]
MSGIYRDVTGSTSIAAARQVVQDFGQRGFNVEIVFADYQNRPDVGVNIARQWFDRDGVDCLVDVATSSVAPAANDICREKNRVHINSSAATSDLTGARCSPNMVHWTYDTWMLANSVGGATVRAGGDA